MAKVRTGGHGYYLEVAAGSGTGIEAAGRWVGTGTPAWGLSGTVGAADLEAVLAGEDPRSGQVLGSARSRVRVAGFDLTFSAPKSVSVLQALGDPAVAEAVSAGHESAVAAAMSYVERHALAVRRPAPTAPVPVPTTVDAVAAAGFVHRLSRALDPHLHTHVVVANLGRGPEGGWSALDGRGVYAHASVTDALYHVHLRHELTERLGVSWDPPDRGRADIAGIGPEMRAEFSRRAAEIAAHLAGRHGAGSRARQVAGHVTRAAKDVHLSADDLRSGWRHRARAVGLGPVRLDAVLDRVPHGPGRAADDGRRQEIRGTTVVDALGALHGAVTRRDVLRAWCRSVPEGVPAAAAEAAADRLLGRMSPEPGVRGVRDGPGVAERRHLVPTRRLDRQADDGGRRRPAEGDELARLLAGRGIGLDRSAARQSDLGLGLG